MADTFEQILERNFDFEGRVCENVPGDRGGATKWGITLDRLRSHTGRNATVAELFALTPAQITEIYRSDYWVKPRIAELPDELRPVIFDWFVNSGTWAIKGIQNVVNDFGFDALKVDGGLGPKSLEAIERLYNKVELEWIIDAFCAERERFYRSIGVGSQEKFLKGWLRRCNAFFVALPAKGAV